MLDIHVVSHTHWDREWYLTYEQFRLRLVALVDRLLDLLDEEPAYEYFHLDGQTIVLEDYLELRPEQERRLRAAITSGRILIGPWYVMPDEFLVSGESIVRNLVRGNRISREFGSPMPVGYLPDLFGHVGQMPQIWRQIGLDNTILWRGFGGRDAEYWWEAPDGSRVLMMHLPPEGYCNATRIAFDPAAAMARAAEKIGYEGARTRTGQALLMNGVDHVEPHAAIPALIEHLSAEPDQRARHSTLPAYVAAVRAAVEAAKPALETGGRRDLRRRDGRDCRRRARAAGGRRPRGRREHRRDRALARRRGVHRSADRQRGAVARGGRERPRSTRDVLAARLDDRGRPGSRRDARRFSDPRRIRRRASRDEPARDAVGAQRPARPRRLVGAVDPPVRLHRLRPLGRPRRRPRGVGHGPGTGHTRA